APDTVEIELFEALLERPIGFGVAGRAPKSRRGCVTGSASSTANETRCAFGRGLRFTIFKRDPIMLVDLFVVALHAFKHVRFTAESLTHLPQFVPKKTAVAGRL